MFDNLSDKLQRVFKNLRGEGRLTAENMETALREVRVALLEADVNFKVVKQLIESVKARAMGQEVLNSLSPSQQIIGIINEELIKVLGSHESRLRFANEPPSVFLIVGLQGSGKTTSTGKLSLSTSTGPRRATNWPLLRAISKFRSTQARPKRKPRSSWRDPRVVKRSTTAATSYWWIPPAACILTISS
jgi:signal recognition particle subunit SRP54